MLWLSLAVGIVISLLDLQHMKSSESMSFTIVVEASVLIIIALLISKVSSGRNWTRITLLVLFVIGFAPAIFSLMKMFTRSLLVSSLGALQLALQGSALYLIFTTPGADCFRNRNEADDIDC